MNVHTEVVLERIPYEPAEWDRTLAGYPQAEVFHSASWLAYLAGTQGAEPVVAAVRAGDRCMGHFVGAVVRRYGLRILGSPMPGWATQHMGFLLAEELPAGPAPAALAGALQRFAFGPMRCVHVELSQRGLTAADLTGAGYTVEHGATYLVDLARGEDVLLSGMGARTRTYVRRADRNGLVVETHTDESFADEYHRQLTEVFARQGLSPTYDVDRVRRLIRAVGPSGQLLLLLVRGPDGAPLASGISVGRGAVAVNWGTACYRAAAALHPNELLWWSMFRRWRACGANCFDMGGRGDYKAKYGGILTPTVRFHRSRPAVLQHGRGVAAQLVRLRQMLPGRAGHAVRQHP